MYELVVQSKQIQEIPMLMPKNVELWNLAPAEQMKIREAFSQGELYVRKDSPEGERLPVVKLWPDPHNPARITLFLK